MLPQRPYFGSGPLPSRKKTVEKRIPQNPKYKNVKPVIDTGSTVKKYIETLRESQRNALNRLDEVFNRMKLTAFVRLVIEYNRSYEYSTEDSTDKDTVKASAPEEKAKSPPLTPFQSVLVGIGELDISHEKHAASLEKDVVSSIPYLLLDVRCKEEYDQCHIITAKNYPYTMLSRSPGYETRDLVQFKNLPEKLIILYDEDESFAPRVASTLVQRGYDNLFLLTGGLKLAHEKFPIGLISGSISTSLFLSKPRREQVPSTKHIPEDLTHRDQFTSFDIDRLQRTMDSYFSHPEAPQTSRQHKPSTQERQMTRRRDVQSARNPPWK